MKLADYLHENGIKYNAFAKKVKISTMTLTRTMEGKHDIRLSIALRIEEATNGKVSCRELLPLRFSTQRGTEKKMAM